MTSYGTTGLGECQKKHIFGRKSSQDLSVPEEKKNKHMLAIGSEVWSSTVTFRWQLLANYVSFTIRPCMCVRVFVCVCNHGESVAQTAQPLVQLPAWKLLLVSTAHC